MLEREEHGWESFWAAAECEASPLLVSLSVVVGGRRGAKASWRCCGLLLIGGRGKDIRLHHRNRFRSVKEK